MDRFSETKNQIIENTSTKIQPFMAQVYGWMTCGLCLTSFVSWFTFCNDVVFNMLNKNKLTSLVLVIIQLLLVFIISGMLHKLNYKIITSLFMLYSVLNGLTMSSIFLTYTMLSISSTFAITAGMFGVMTIYGYTTKKDLSSLGSLLFMALIGITLAFLINSWLKSNILVCIISYISIAVFMCLIVYDTQKLKNLGNSLNNDCSNEIVRKNAVVGALNLYLDVVNLFLFLLRILGNKR